MSRDLARAGARFRSEKRHGHRLIRYFENAYGEWCILVEPEALRIDNFHPDHELHPHRSQNDQAPIPLASLSPSEVHRRLLLHLDCWGALLPTELAQELNRR